MSKRFMSKVALICLAFVSTTVFAQPCGGLSRVSKVQSTEVTYTFDYGGQTYERPATVFAPKSGTQTRRCPIVIAMPGGCQDMDSALWMGPLFASRGYVVMVSEVMVSDIWPQGKANVQICDSAARASIDFMQSVANPYHDESDVNGLVGGIGYSLGARVWVKTQEVDERVGAIVAFDNLAISEDGDIGSPACINEPGIIREPVAPAMGQAAGLTCVDGRPIDSKMSGYNHWRDFGVGTMQLVFADCGHDCWSGRTSAKELRPIFAYYGVAWLDVYLKGSTKAVERLLNPEIRVGRQRYNLQDIIDPFWTSGIYIPEIADIDCPDLRSGCGGAADE